ncbi:MAG: hypothetical protein IIA59_01580 [Candidatus Marinimicrobia bacterium]|nr:hypothetical protein [Candidatus Neomarinimicrobiota bacterium]
MRSSPAPIRFNLIPATLMLMLMGCNQPAHSNAPAPPPVNLSHILSLVDSLQTGGASVAYVNIYAEYPDYDAVTAPGEGIAAVDDVGRLLEVLEAAILENERYDLLPVAKGLTRFLLMMQTSDGLWHNFIFADGAINTTHKNSVASFGWWAARGLRGLAAAYHIFKESDSTLAELILARFQLGNHHLNASLSKFPLKVETAQGPRAGWLPSDAPDMSAEFLLALAKMTKESPLDYRQEIQLLSAGILTFQLRSAGSDLDGMFYSWQNIWHNWGNLQALALLEGFALSQDSTLLAAVERWADGFLSWQADQGYYWEIAVTEPTEFSLTAFPQIAYGLGSSFKGIHRLAATTGLERHHHLARRLLGWFQGDNHANRAMYDPQTGRCYDGINSPVEVNLNSGAESTIEALLALQFARADD